VRVKLDDREPHRRTVEPRRLATVSVYRDCRSTARDDAGSTRRGRIAGLTSAWEGRKHDPGTSGPSRSVDDVHGPGPAEAVTMVSTASDHRAIVVRRPDPANP
jgi:hypothetical protein